LAYSLQDSGGAIGSISGISVSAVFDAGFAIALDNLVFSIGIDIALVSGTGTAIGAALYAREQRGRA